MQLLLAHLPPDLYPLCHNPSPELTQFEEDPSANILATSLSDPWTGTVDFMLLVPNPSGWGGQIYSAPDAPQDVEVGNYGLGAYLDNANFQDYWYGVIEYIDDDGKEEVPWIRRDTLMPGELFEGHVDNVTRAVVEGRDEELVRVVEEDEEFDGEFDVVIDGYSDGVHIVVHIQDQIEAQIQDQDQEPDQMEISNTAP
ncbi:hypothetical protein BDV12DRAFT_199331 [Aspergillus spectabilis]